MGKMSAKQGESTQLYNVSIEDLVDYTDYNCNVTIKNADTEEVVLGPLSIPLDTNKFPVALTPLQTAALPVDDYTVITVVDRTVATVVEFQREVSWALTITPSLLAME